jgi:hypothetical protein
MALIKQSASKNAQDAQGGGKGILIQDEHTGALRNFQQSVCYGFEQEIAETLDASYYKGCGERQGKERTVVCVGNGQMCNITMQPIANTLDTMHDQQAVLCYGLDRASFNQGKNAKYDFSVQEEIAQPIVAKGPGGGTDETVGALCARDYKGVGSQYVNEGKCVIQQIR